MNIPGVAGATETPEMLERAQEETERLLKELKDAVKLDARDIGVLRKELHITVPAKVIADHLEQNYKELMHDAFVPGFRKGRAPRRLIEKRFGGEVRESLTTAVVGQSFYAAAENAKLETLGDPLFRIDTDAGAKLMEFSEAMQHLKLPEQGDFGYVCEVELKPAFELPELKGIEVKFPEIKITKAMVDEQILRRRKLRGRYELIDEPAQKDDMLVADVALSVDGVEVKREDNATFGVRPARVEGIPLLTLDETLTGVKPGEARQADCVIPDDFEQADLRGKAGRFEFKVHEIKRLVPEVLEESLKAWGVESENELQKDVRADLESERDQLLERAKKAQVEEYLLKNTKLDLPESFSTRQTDRAVSRRIVELQQKGMAASDIEARIDELRTSAQEEVGAGLRVAFILDKVAETLKVEVTDEEVNTEIARMARLYNRRFDRVRDDLQSRGLLEQLVEQIRHGKCLEALLKDAKLVGAPADEKEST
jgi:trigger factor